MDEYIRAGQTLGLEGQELRQFVIEQQEQAREERRMAREEREREREREEREREREREREEREHEREREEREREREREERERERERAFELEKMRLVSPVDANQSNENPKSAKRPQIQGFADGKDRIDAYLLRFER